MGTVLEAIEQVLADEGKPLHYEEITERILSQGLWETNGKTPWQTISARISIDIRENPDTKLVRTKTGIYGLKVWGLAPLSVNDKTPSEISEGNFSYADAAELVLDEIGKPTHYGTLIKEILKRKLIKTQSKSPQTTLMAVLVQETKRYQDAGNTPRFDLQGKGVIGLTKWLPTGILANVSENNQKIKDELLDYLRQMEPAKFEQVVGVLLAKMGFDDVEVTRVSKDGGIDVKGVLIVAENIRFRLVIQVKRQKQNVHSPIIQQLRGSLNPYEQGLVVTTSDFASGARDEANEPNRVPIGLINGKQLVDLLFQYEIGVQREPLELFRTDFENILQFNSEL